jgi:hypothetical protein
MTTSEIITEYAEYWIYLTKYKYAPLMVHNRQAGGCASSFNLGSLRRSIWLVLLLRFYSQSTLNTIFLPISKSHDFVPLILDTHLWPRAFPAAYLNSVKYWSWTLVAGGSSPDRPAASRSSKFHHRPTSFGMQERFQTTVVGNAVKS